MDGCGGKSHSFNLLWKSLLPARFKNEGARVVIIDLPLYVYADFFDAQGKLTPQSKVGSTLKLNFYGCPCYLQE